jgi:hypothetical protein
MDQSNKWGRQRASGQASQQNGHRFNNNQRTYNDIRPTYNNIRPAYNDNRPTYNDNSRYGGNRYGGNHNNPINIINNFNIDVRLTPAEKYGNLVEKIRVGAPTPDIEYWIDVGAKPNDVGADGMTPLHHAVLRGRSHVVDKMLRTDARNVNAVNRDGKTPLALAKTLRETTEKWEIVQKLRERGATDTPSSSSNVAQTSASVPTATFEPFSRITAPLQAYKPILSPLEGKCPTYCTPSLRALLIPQEVSPQSRSAEYRSLDTPWDPPGVRETEPVYKLAGKSWQP